MNRAALARREALSLRAPRTEGHQRLRSSPVARPVKGYVTPSMLSLIASGIARSPPVRVPGSCPLLEPCRWRVDYRGVPSTVIRGIGPRASPIVSITLGRSRRERLAAGNFRLRRASARSHVGSRSIPLARRPTRSKQTVFLAWGGRLSSLHHSGTRAGSRVARGGRPQAAQRACRWIPEAREHLWAAPRRAPRGCPLVPMRKARRHLVAPHCGDRPRRVMLDKNISTQRRTANCSSASLQETRRSGFT